MVGSTVWLADGQALKYKACANRARARNCTGLCLSQISELYYFSIFAKETQLSLETFPQAMR